MTFATFTEAYRHSLFQLINSGETVAGVADPTSVGSAFGTKNRPYREILDYGFTLESGCERMLKPCPDFIDYSFSSANLLWFLSGSSKVADIACYSSKGTQFSGDGVDYSCALGGRCCRNGELNQIQAVVDCLRQDQSSRRAVIVFYSASDTTLRPRDTPCAVFLQFLIRRQRLICYCVMRSQSAGMILPHDVYLFTTLQELIACKLGVAIGEYIHRAGSYHFYEDELEKIESVLHDQSADDVSKCEPRAKAGDYDLIESACVAESHLRTSVESGLATPEATNVSAFWDYHLGNANRRIMIQIAVRQERLYNTNL